VFGKNLYPIVHDFKEVGSAHVLGGKATCPNKDPDCASKKQNRIQPSFRTVEYL